MSLSFPGHQAPGCPHLCPHTHTWPPQLCALWFGHISLLLFSISSPCLIYALKLSHPLRSVISLSRKSSTFTGHGHKSKLIFWIPMNHIESCAVFDQVHIPAFLQRGWMEWFIIPSLGIQSIDPVAAAALDKLLFKVSEGFKGLCPLSY